MYIDFFVDFICITEINLKPEIFNSDRKIACKSIECISMKYIIFQFNLHVGMLMMIEATSESINLADSLQKLLKYSESNVPK